MLLVSKALIEMNQVQHFYNAVTDEVCQRLLNEIPSHYKYHTLRHTLDVIQQCHRIGQAEGLDDHGMQIVRAAALFHDTGYIFNRKNHEELSCEFFRSLASAHDLPLADQSRIEGCIMATKISQSPASLEERVVCDADLDYLGREDFEEIAELLYLELQACGEIEDREAWNKLQVRFLGSYQYHTQLGQSTRQPALDLHLRHLIEIHNL
jgi:uncharacterized protein